LQLRDYQSEMVSGIETAWESVDNVCAVAPCGGGKTVIFSHLMRKEEAPCLAMAHRKELVNQIALSLAMYEVPHRIVGPVDLVKLVVNTQMDVLGTSFYNSSAQCTVAGVDTLIRREGESWLKQVRKWTGDECHHFIRGNKWGKAVDMMPNAKGLGVTATPCRSDGLGIGRHADGVFDTMVQGPTMRELIDAGWLTDYRIFAALSDIDIADVNITAGGDFSPVKLKKAVRRSHIVGDVVESYLNISPGKQGITFVTDVETAGDIAAEYNRKGVTAEVVTANTPAMIRNEIVKRFRRKELMQLVNVDIFGEGFDLPAIEVVSMARHTASYGLYVQQFGRVLRIMEGKTKGIIIDHVGNVMRHGLPDKARVWDLDARERKPRAVDPDDDIPLRYCPECTCPYERILIGCPFCGHIPEPAGRSTPEQVEGDLFELDPEVLARMRGDIRKVDKPDEVAHGMRKGGTPEYIVKAFSKKAIDRCEAQAALRGAMDWWAAWQRQKGKSDRESYRLFWHAFGVDVYTAQTLGKPEALKLADKVNQYIGRMAA